LSSSFLKKIIIWLTWLAADINTLFELFDGWRSRKKQMKPLMKVFDTVNYQYGRV
jgi:hypothetical protein